MDQSIQVIVLGRSTTFPLPSQLPTPGIFKSSCCFFSSPEGHIRPLDRCNAQFGKFGARSRWPRGRRSPRCRLCMDDAASLSGLICTFLACLQKFVGEGVFVISWMRWTRGVSMRWSAAKVIRTSMFRPIWRVIWLSKFWWICPLKKCFHEW